MTIIRVCLDSSVCRLSSRDHELLLEKQNSLADEYKTKDQLQFFTVDELVRVAVTGNNVDAPIYGYSNELYSPTGKPITLEFAVGKLVHELGHHHGIKDTQNDWLDQLGEKVERGFEHRALTTQTNVVSRGVVSASYYEGDNGYRELLFSDSKTMFDATTLVAGQIGQQCMVNDLDETTHWPRGKVTEKSL